MHSGVSADVHGGASEPGRRRSWVRWSAPPCTWSRGRWAPLLASRSVHARRGGYAPPPDQGNLCPGVPSTRRYGMTSESRATAARRGANGGLMGRRVVGGQPVRHSSGGEAQVADLVEGADRLTDEPRASNQELVSFGAGVGGASTGSYRASSPQRPPAWQLLAAWSRWRKTRHRDRGDGAQGRGPADRSSPTPRWYGGRRRMCPDSTSRRTSPMNHLSVNGARGRSHRRASSLVLRHRAVGRARRRVRCERAPDT
jgi:hypothetical protein